MAQLFWKWTADYQDQAYNGLRPWIKEDLPIWMKPQIKYKFLVVRGMVVDNMKKLVLKGYMKVGVVLALNSFFLVPKLMDDIIMIVCATLIQIN